MRDDRDDELERMGIDAGELERLRDAFASGAESAAPTTDCPAADDIWAAARQEATGDEVARIVDHTATCALCAEAWRMAAEVIDEPADSEEALNPVRTDHIDDRRPEPPAWTWWLRPAVPAVAFALLAVAVGVGYFVGGTGLPAPTMRGDDASGISSDVEESLPRDAFELRWSAVAEGATYELTATYLGDPTRTVAAARLLEEPVFRVPAEAFDGIASGARIDWRVVALLPDGSRRSSTTFSTVLQ